MMIGPAPMMRIEEISVRLGMSRSTFHGAGMKKPRILAPRRRTDRAVRIEHFRARGKRIGACVSRVLAAPRSTAALAGYERQRTCFLELHGRDRTAFTTWTCVNIVSQPEEKCS